MAETTEFPALLDVSSAPGLLNQSLDTYLYNNPDLPYNSMLYYIILTLHICFIPIIIIPSTIVISTVVFLRKLQNPLNISLLAVSLSDLWVALFVIPVHVLVDVAITRERINEYNHIRVGLLLLADAIDMIDFSVLVLLGWNTTLQYKFPLKLKKFTSIKKTVALIIIITLLHILSSLIFYGLMVWKNAIRNSMINNVDKSANLINQFYDIHILVISGTLMVTCFSFGINIRCLRWKRGKRAAERITTCILMAFVLFFTPTFLFWTNILKFDKHNEEFLMHIARLIRYLSATANACFICFFSPTYRFAFKYFKSTNPLLWKNLEKFIEDTNRTVPAVIRIHDLVTDDVHTTTCVDYGPVPLKSVGYHRDSFMVTLKKRSTGLVEVDDFKYYSDVSSINDDVPMVPWLIRKLQSHPFISSRLEEARSRGETGEGGKLEGETSRKK